MKILDILERMEKEIQVNLLKKKEFYILKKKTNRYWNCKRSTAIRIIC